MPKLEGPTTAMMTLSCADIIFFNNHGIGKNYPPKLDNFDIKTEVSSKFDFENGC